MLQEVINNINSATLFVLVFILALVNCALYIVAVKVSLIAWYEAHRQKWMPKKCEFCLFFWMSLFEVFPVIFKYPPLDVFNIGMILALSLAAAVLSVYFLPNKI